MDWLRSFMKSRNGMDNLSSFMLIVSLILLIFARFIDLEILNIVALVTIGFAYFRVFSKNTRDRYLENLKYLQKTSSIRKKFQSMFKETRDRKDYKYFKCSECKQKVRVPKGKGKIVVTCPKCKNKMNKRT